MKQNPISDLPLGFGMALMQNKAALQRYALLPEGEKHRIIAAARGASSKEEMAAIVASLVPPG